MSYKGSEWNLKTEWKRVSIKIKKEIFDRFKEKSLESVNSRIIKLIENNIKED